SLTRLYLFLPQKGLSQVGAAKRYKSAVAVPAEQRASEAGKQILRQGGNAIDAAVAVQFALAVTVPRAGNIGGGGFMVIHLTDGPNKTLDFREVAPLESSPDMYLQNGEYIRSEEH